MKKLEYKLNIGIVIPAVNPDAEILQQLIEQIHAVCVDNYNYKILIVDDGSMPPISGQALALNCELLVHPENRGKGAALKSGFNYFLNESPAEIIITMDADLQHPPEKIPAFIETFAQHSAEIVVGNRKRTLKTMPFHRILSNSITSKIISWMSGQKVPDGQCGFRLIRSDILNQQNLQENGFFLESELLIRAGEQNFKIASVPIPTIYNNQKSAVKNVSDTLNFVRLILRLLKERLIKYV